MSTFLAKSISKIRRTDGFSIIEVVIASFIVVIGFTAVLELGIRSEANLSFSQERLVAANLAQEGIEYIRNLRDECYIKACAGWLDEFQNEAGDVPGVGSEFCYKQIDVSKQNPELGPQSSVDCDNTDSAPFILFNKGTGYGYNVGSPTSFKRVVILRRPENRDYELEITSVVSGVWRGKKFEIKAEDHLFNWFE